MKKLDQPMFSIVIPTRDRPDLVALSLRTLQRQTFQNFEVIVSDNAVSRRFDPGAVAFDSGRFQYLRPPKALWMTDHWEFALGHASGRYVGILGDKSMLVPTALQCVADKIVECSPDAVSWGTATWDFFSEDPAGPGRVIRARTRLASLTTLTGEACLRHLLSTYLDAGFTADHQEEIQGSIYHGFYSRELVELVKRRFGRLFRFYAPDVNGKCAAMQHARTVLHFGGPFELVLARPSNGTAVCVRASHMLSTQAEAAAGESGTSPKLIPGLSASTAHLLACDLVDIADQNLSNAQWVELHRKAAFDLYRFEEWPSANLRREERRALWASVARLQSAERAKVLAERWKGRRVRIAAQIKKKLARSAGMKLASLRRSLSPRATHLQEHDFSSLRAALEQYSIG